MNNEDPHEAISLPWRFSKGHLYIFIDIYFFLSVQKSISPKKTHICKHLYIFNEYAVN